MSRHLLPYLAVARVSGPDAAAFLHAQLSADLVDLRQGNASFACYCSPRGQVYGLLLACRRSEDFLLIGAASLLPSLLQKLRMFVLRSRVELVEDPSLAVLGDAGEPEPGSTAPGNRWVTPTGAAYCVLPASGLPADTASASDWKAEELAQGVAWLDERTSERFIPQMLGFDRIGAVSFRKGCYPGQEIVARARYLGTIKRAPLQLRLDTEPEVGQRMLDGLETGAVVALVTGDDRLDGTVVDHVRLPDGRPLLFLVAPLQAAEAEAVEVDGRGYRCATM